MSAKPPMPDPWNVTIDASGELREQPVDPVLVERLVARLSEYAASVSHRPRRYTTRLTVWEDDAMAAASVATEVWEQAIGELELPVWPITRLEVQRAS